MIEDSGGEAQPDAFKAGGPQFDDEEIIVTRRGFVTKAAFDDREDNFPLLPLLEWSAQVAKEFAARGFKEVQIARIVYMVAGRTFGVGDAVAVLERSQAHVCRQINNGRWHVETRFNPRKGMAAD